MHGTVRRDAEQQLPSARVVSHVQVGEVVETPLVYWTLILMWPVASMRERWLRAALALPGFLAVEALTTPAQLLGPLAQASAILAGDDDPLTVWDRWSRFLEAGGQFVFVTAAAITVTCWPRSATAPRSRVSAN
jgi:hypothetical protein